MRETQSRSRPSRRWLMLVLLPALACTMVESPDADAPWEDAPLHPSRSEVVYGTDDRQDVYAHPDATLRARAQQATVAVMFAGALNTTNPDNVTFTAPTLGARHDLCETERFRQDPVVAICSGTLIDTDLVLTAGHCFSTTSDCTNLRLVFNYYRTTADTLRTVTTQDIFSCASIVARKQGSVDYALVRLDRPATPRFTPAPVSTGSRALASGQRLAVIGCPSGIPFKIDAGGAVRDPRAGSLDYFVGSTDTFAANSGSGVYETGGYTVAGILVRGDTDYVSNGDCNVVNTCGEAGCRGEDSTYVYPAMDGLCRVTNNASSRLCGNRTADFNSDGNLDVLWHHRTEDKSAIWFMRDGELLSDVVHDGTSDVQWQPVSTGDFDSDGNLDLLRHHRTQGLLSLWFLRGDTVLSRTVLQGPTDVNWHPVTARDFDSDGNLDILWHHRTRGQVAFWFMRAGTRLSEGVLQGLGNVNWYPVAAADFNGDGDLDVLWHHRTQGQVTLWFMRAGALLSSVRLTGFSDVNWRPISAGDLDGDGGMDLLWHHRTQGRIGIWFMRNGAVRSVVVRPGLSPVSWYVVR